VTPAQIVEEWALPRLALHEDIWLVEARSGELAGYAMVWMEDPPSVFVAEQTVHPDHRGHGLSEFLLQLCEMRAAGGAGRATGGAPTNLRVWTHEDDVERRSLYKRHGLRYARTFLRLEVDLAELAAAVWPPGIAVRRFCRHRDEAAVHAAPRKPFRITGAPRAWTWTSGSLTASRRRSSTWTCGGSRGAAGRSPAACWPSETPLGGYIDTLLRAQTLARARLGRALLRRLLPNCADAASPAPTSSWTARTPTGAMGLYKSVGMRPRRGAHLVFEKDLPGG